MVDVDTLRSLRTLAASLLSRIDAALAGVDEDASLRRGKTPAAIVALLARKGPLKPAAIVDELRDAGRDVTQVAVQQACCRLKNAGRLKRTRRGYDVVAEGTT